MKNEWKKLWLYIAALLVLIISAITSFSKEKRSYGNATEIKDSIKTILPSDSLNVYLTNEMSDSPDMEGFDKKVNNFMSVWQLRGVSLSVFRNDSLLFSKGYGMADKENHIEMSPRNILRIASVSKLITATGIMRLIEQKKLSLKDTVFGARGILNDEEYKINAFSSLADGYMEKPFSLLLINNPLFYKFLTRIFFATKFPLNFYSFRFSLSVIDRRNICYFKPFATSQNS